MLSISKKLFIIMMCILLVFALTACSDGSKDDGNQKPPVQDNNPGDNGETPGNGGQLPMNEDNEGNEENNDEEQKGTDETSDGSLQDWGGVKGRILTGDYPQEVEEYIEANKTEESQQALNVGYRTIIVMTMGEKPSAGYGIELKDARLENGVLTISAAYNKPAKGSVVATVITYPTLVLELDDIYLGHYKIEYDIEK